MTKGKHPRPTRLVLLEARNANTSRGGKPIRRDEPQPREDPPKMPRGLSARAQEEWRYTLWAMEPTKVYTAADRGALIVFCELMDHFWQYREAGEMMGAPQIGQLLRAIDFLGLSPSSRTRIVAPPKGKVLDPVEAIRQRKAVS